MLGKFPFGPSLADLSRRLGRDHHLEISITECRLVRSLLGSDDNVRSSSPFWPPSQRDGAKAADKSLIIQRYHPAMFKGCSAPAMRRLQAAVSLL